MHRCTRTCMQQCVHYLHRLLRPRSSAAKSFFTSCFLCVGNVSVCVSVCVQRGVNIYAVANRRHRLAGVLFLGTRCA